MSVSSILLFTERNQKNIAEATVEQWDRPANFTCLEKSSYSGSDPLLQHFNILLQLFLMFSNWLQCIGTYLAVMDTTNILWSLQNETQEPVFAEFIW